MLLEQIRPLLDLHRSKAGIVSAKTISARTSSIMNDALTYFRGAPRAPPGPAAQVPPWPAVRVLARAAVQNSPPVKRNDPAVFSWEPNLRLL